MNERREALHVPMDVPWSPSWLSWVAATTTCLRTLGSECDTVDVAGMSGYAFHLCVVRGLCPSGPTMFDWGLLLPGVARLGRSALVFQTGGCIGPKGSDAERLQYREAFEVARREVAAGRPCVLWGAYIPEFAAVVGVTDDTYLVRSFKECRGEPQPPIPFAELDAPGGAYVLGFPTPVAAPPEADLRAIAEAVARFRGPLPERNYRYGTAAYDLWIEELQARHADAGGNSYNAACYAEGRRFAGEFLQRIAARNPALADPLHQAAADYGIAAEAMARVAKQFPFPGRWGTVVEDTTVIDAAVTALRKAREAESRAIERLVRVVERD